MGAHSIRPPTTASEAQDVDFTECTHINENATFPTPCQTRQSVLADWCWGGVGGSTKLIYFNESSDLAALAHRSFVPSAVCPAAAAPCCVSWMWWEIYVHVCTTLLGFCTLLVVMMRLPVRFSHSTPIKYSEHFTQDLLKRRETFSVIQIWNVL